jgi:O-antigen/teichoic acid export membrane protein
VLRRLLRAGPVSHSGLTYVSSLLTLAVNLVTGVLLARILGTTGRGELAAILVLPLMLAWAFSPGCAEAVSYHQARHPEDGARLIGTWLALLVPFIALAVLVGQLLLPVIFSAQTEAATNLAQIYLLTVILALISTLVYGVLLGDQDFAFYSIMRFAQPGLIAVLYLSMWQLDLLTVKSALAATAFASVAGLIVAGRRAVKRHGLGRPSFHLGLSTLWYGVRAHGTNLGGILNERLDLLIIPAFLAAPSVGLYSVATNVSSIVVSLAGALALMVLPAAARQREHSGTVIRSLHVTLAVGCAVALALGVVAKVGVRLIYGQDFAESVTPLEILLPGSVLYAGASVLWSGLYAANRPFTAALTQAGGLVVTVSGLVIFLRSGGITAAALVSTTSYSLVFVAALILYRRAAGLRWHAFVPSLRPLRPRASAG